mmetsp:Transcript_26176/g.78664  ORF Transcript_26176/g.78664 Transcript_26176/m.78664 type:complete len:118 (-) Transcript_26176:34-387(-)
MAVVAVALLGAGGLVSAGSVLLLRRRLSGPTWLCILSSTKSRGCYGTNCKAGATTKRWSELEVHHTCRFIREQTGPKLRGSRRNNCRESRARQQFQEACSTADTIVDIARLSAGSLN